MKASARIISLAAAAFLLVAPALVSLASKPKTSAEKAVQGTVVAFTDTNLVIRKGNSDLNLLYDDASKKPSTLAAGSSVLVHYRDEKNKHIVTTVEVTDGKSNSNQPQAK